MTEKPTYEELEQSLKESLIGKKGFAISLIDNAPVFFVAVDAQGKTLMMNQIMMKVLGYTDNEVVGKDYLSNFVPKKDRDMLASVFRKLTADQEHTFNENHILSKDGKEFLVEWHGTPVFDTSSKLQYFYGIGIDITSRKQTEKALRESEEKYRQLFSTVSDAVMVIDAETREFIDVNEAASSIYGYSKEEFLQLKQIDITSEPKKSDDYIKKTISGEISSIPLRYHKHKDGTIFPVEITPGVLTLGKRKMVFGVARDITERKRAEEALKESELKHKTLVNNIPGMVYRGYTDWSAEIISGSEEICGYTKKKINSEKEGWLSIIHSDDKESVFSEGSELAKGKQSTIQTYRIVTKGNGNRWVEDRKTSLFSEEGEFIGIDGIVFDITKRKQAEEALWKSEERLSAFMDSATDGFILFDSELNYVKFNKAAQEITGVDRKEIIGKNVLDVIPDFKETGRYDKYKKVIKTGVPMITPDLTPHPKFGNKRLDLKVFKVGEGLGVIFTDITERKQTEEALQKAHDELDERVKELNCFYGISKIIEMPDIAFEEMLQKIVDLISTSWQYPEITCARIIIEGQEYKTKNFKETTRKQAGNIVVHGKRIGILEICYLEERPESDEGPFLKEERSLISAITERLGRVTEHKQAERALRKAYDELEHRVKERTRELEIKTNSLEEINTAMKVLLKKREEDKTELEDNVLTNVKELIDPYFEKIKKTKLDDHQEAFLSIIESNLNEIVSPFTRKMS
ncbi:MAG: PAS domain S-box protein, partial [Desulfobacterales bacterium]